MLDFKVVGVEHTVHFRLHFYIFIFFYRRLTRSQSHRHLVELHALALVHDGVPVLSVWRHRRLCVAKKVENSS